MTSRLCAFDQKVLDNLAVRRGFKDWSDFLGFHNSKGRQCMLEEIKGAMAVARQGALGEIKQLKKEVKKVLPEVPHDYGGGYEQGRMEALIELEKRLRGRKEEDINGR